VIGLGTVGRWVLRTLHERQADLRSRYGLEALVVGAANARDGFVHDEGGLALPALVESLDAGRPITGLAGVGSWPDAAAGMAATEADVLIEVADSPRADGEPGYAHMLSALVRGVAVVTSNKWPVALHGIELAATARERSIEFRAESTVMSGTPVISTLLEGLGGARPTAIRGVLNATCNDIATRMAAGEPYERALAAAQAAGLAEPDPAADVEGWDATAKLMILSALVFGRPLGVDDVARRGVSETEADELAAASALGGVVKPVETLRTAGDELSAATEPTVLDPDDPLARVEGASNALICSAEPLGEVTIIGPGAGPELAGQGVLSDLIAVARRRP
jgi:homoserine dehydrogenase